MTPPVEVHGLVHDYGQGPVLEVPELTLVPGRVHLAGPNGAGKTTLLRVLATLLAPTRGHVRVLGELAARHPRRVRAHVGYAGPTPSLHGALAARAALALHADLHEVEPARVDEALEAWDLADQAEVAVATLSRGQALRLDLARALLHRPAVVLLDEPTGGLDQHGRERLDAALAAVEPELVIVAHAGDPGLATDETVRLVEGRVQGAPP